MALSYDRDSLPLSLGLEALSSRQQYYQVTMIHRIVVQEVYVGHWSRIYHCVYWVLLTTFQTYYYLIHISQPFHSEGRQIGWGPWRAPTSQPDPSMDHDVYIWASQSWRWALEGFGGMECRQHLWINQKLILLPQLQRRSCCSSRSLSFPTKLHSLYWISISFLWVNQTRSYRRIPVLWSINMCYHQALLLNSYTHCEVAFGFWLFHKVIMTVNIVDWLL